MDETLLNQLKQSLHEAIEHANSDWTIRQLPQDEKPPMDLLLLADPSEQNIAQYIFESEVYVAVENQNVIGVYVLKEVTPGKVELMNVAVAETHQGKGIGKALVLHAVGRAKLHGMRSIEIGTGNSSIQQLALYQKCGFRLKEIVPDYFNTNYAEPIFGKGIQCRDMVRLQLNLD